MLGNLLEPDRGSDGDNKHRGGDDSQHEEQTPTSSDGGLPSGRGALQSGGQPATLDRRPRLVFGAGSVSVSRSTTERTMRSTASASRAFFLFEETATDRRVALPS